MDSPYAKKSREIVFFISLPHEFVDKIYYGLMTLPVQEGHLVIFFLGDFLAFTRATFGDGAFFFIRILLR